MLLLSWWSENGIGSLLSHLLRHMRGERFLVFQSPLMPSIYVFLLGGRGGGRCLFETGCL